MDGFPPMFRLAVPVDPILPWNIPSPARREASLPSETNEVRDTIDCWLSEVCSDVCIEPTLQPITGETLFGATAITEDGVRLDIAANGFGGRGGRRYERTYFNVSLQFTGALQSPTKPRLHLQKARANQN